MLASARRDRPIDEAVVGFHAGQVAEIGGLAAMSPGPVRLASAGGGALTPAKGSETFPYAAKL